MSVRHQILGQPGRDNALYVEIDTGQAIHRLLFDCGEGCLRELAVSQLQAIDALMFSHFHIDHAAGFDEFLRSNYNREAGPVRLWGPAEAGERIHHRLQGVTWNLVDGAPGEFVVTDIHADRLATTSFLTRERFAVAHGRGEAPFSGTVIDHPDFRVTACLLNHGTPSVAYCVREMPRMNVDMAALGRLGLGPGAWLKQVKDPAVNPDEEIHLGGKTFRIGPLREQLLATTPGESIAYLSDFQLDTESETRLAAMLEGCTTIVCECSFRNAEEEQARRTFHVVSADVGRLAARLAPRQLILFHLSDRYTRSQWLEQLEEVQTLFPRTCFPESWKLGPPPKR